MSEPMIAELERVRRENEELRQKLNKATRERPATETAQERFAKLSYDSLFALRLDDVEVDDQLALFEERARRGAAAACMETNITSGETGFGGQGITGVQQGWHRTRL